MNQQAKLREYLRDMGEKEREVRKPLSQVSSTVDQRSKVLALLNDLLIFQRGFFNCVTVLHGEQLAKELRLYYAQARSKKGLKP